MAKQHRRLKGGAGQRFELSEELDDRLIPSPEELGRYAQVDPKTSDFIRESAGKELTFRHNMHEKGMKLSFREQGLQHGLNYLGLTFAFALGIAGIWFSYKLLELNKDMQGTIFGGVMLAYLIYLFVGVANKRAKQPPPNSQ
ncbi:MAG: DUF2335 domain-containing protein [Flavobacteriales bacterium]|nr:DUF2335 domain-containing protein [Flavobacteriales bacterium]